MKDAKVLIIDDEPDIRELLSLTLSRMGLNSDVADTFKNGLEQIKKNEYFLVLTDMRLPDGEGYEIVRFIQQNKPQLPVAVITAYGNIEGAVNTLKAGAFDYVSKPIDLSMLKSLVKTALEMYQRPEPQVQLLLGNTPAMEALRQNIYKLARSQAPVFIHGESGVGKELVARLIHAYGPRSEKAFIAVNCGAIPSELMESEFFGHKKGSFTGAFADKQGLFVAAQGGTLFLDEIAELPLAMQVKLLRAIQEKAVKPIGEANEIPVDVRILSASNKNLQEEIAAGRFRQELYYRIDVIELRVPTLHERANDIPLIADSILAKLSKEQNRKSITLSKEAIAALKQYPFPGNVRELENILERAMTLCNGDDIKLHDLQLPNIQSPDKTTIVESSSSPRTTINLDKSLEEHEKELILNALEKTKWNRTAAAKLLGVSFRTLRYRLKKLGLD
ncbi:two-component system response regulator PilR (plasmid) [Legionella adelaidensis]|uniref:Two component response regulator PilR n=1 Tax=Legionella adelaidensis TaxID=45056 RepID=A0A0W0R426_9GAMM|nr:sigma-54 dependent transcriptional regulator [Legionella adelaidensis]KTC65813.1 two component response regulator PilR [Legionella adelaidensis]VEH85241.1 two-component system response regulator PilR [Legionella adelaidensis]